MTAENKANFIVDLAGNVAQKAKSFGSAISAMGKSGSRSMKLLSVSMSASNKVLDKFDNKLVGFATGGGLVMAAKKVGDWQQQLTELGSRYNLTAEQSDEFLNTVYATGATYKMPYNDVITALDKMLERTNDVSGSINNVDNIAKAIKGLGLSADEAGSHVSQLMNKGFTPEGINKLLNGVASASKIGTGNIKEQFSGLIDLTKGTQWQSPEQLMQMLAIQRLSDAQLGNSNDSASAMKSFAAAIKDKEKQKILKLNGINVYNDKDKKQFKDPAQLLLEIGNRAKFKDHNLGTIFDENLIKTTKAFASSEQQQKLLSGVKIEDGLLEEKTAKNINTFNGALTSLTNAGERWAQLKLAKPIQDLADALNSLTPEQLDEYTNKLETGAKVIGGAIAARYAYRGYKGVKGFFSNGKSGNQALESAVSSDVTKVYVTNWPDDFKASSLTDNKKGNTASDIASDIGRNNMGKAFATVGMLQELSSHQFKLPNKEHVEVYQDPFLQPQKDVNSYSDEELKGYDVGNVPTSLQKYLGTWVDNYFQNNEKRNAFNDNFKARNVKERQGIDGNMPVLKQEKSEIVLKIESSDGLTVKTKSISAADTDIVVNTGKTYGGAY